MGRVLLLMTTATYRAAAFLEAGERLGLPVVVGSERPQVLAWANPGGSITLDFSAPHDAARAIVAFAEDYPITAVLAADDDGAILAATAAAALGLRHNSVEAVSAARDKYRMREVLSGAGLPSPRFVRFSVDDDPADAARRVDFPCVVKPLSLSASRGVIRANDLQQFVAAFGRVAAILRRPEVAAQGGAPARQVLVESFIPGIEVALEGLLSDGELRVLALYDKPDPLEGPFFEETIYVTPSRLPDGVQSEIATCTARAMAALGLREGPVHAELRINERGPWIIEIAPRSIGGLCSRTLRFVRGTSAAGRPADAALERSGAHARLAHSGDRASLEELILRQALGLDVDSFERESRSAGVMMIPIPRHGILREVRGQEEAENVPGVEEVKLTIPVGQEVVPLPEGMRYLGFIFARDRSPERVEAALREAHRRLEFVITPVEEIATEAEIAEARQHPAGGLACS